MSAHSATPIDVQVQITSADEGTVAIDNGSSLRGVTVGETMVKVTPVNVDKRFQNLSASVAVQVKPANDDPASDDEPRELLLTGPAQNTVGATAQFRVELIGPDGSRDVTSDGASLVLDRDQQPLATVSPGGVVVGNQPGSVSVKARYRDLISAPVQLRIEPLAIDFVRLEIDIDPKPLTVGEKRPYKLWGYPRGGGTRQDLTNGMLDSSVPIKPVVALRPESGIAEHQPPIVIAKQPGSIEMIAQVGQGNSAVKSNRVKLEVVDSADEPTAGVLAVEPARISVRVGETAPPVRVLMRRPGEHTPREIDAPLTSEDPSVLTPLTDGSGGFLGQQPGTSRLLAKVGEQQAAVEATVVGNPFQQVAIGDVDLAANNQFSVAIRVSGGASADTQYRVFTAEGAMVGDWRLSQGGSVELNSPTFALGSRDTVYHLVLESRGPDGSERYPCSFRLVIGTEEQH
jgi:hypothetical protein